jgi:hypothetical protein
MRGLDPPPGPKPLRRAHPSTFMKRPSVSMDGRVKPGHREIVRGESYSITAACWSGPAACWRRVALVVPIMSASGIEARMKNMINS